MSAFGWCETGQHDLCKREYQRFVIEPNRRRGQPPYKVVWLDEWRQCECPKRGCECYVKAKDRTKPKKRARRKQ